MLVIPINGKAREAGLLASLFLTQVFSTLVQSVWQYQHSFLHTSYTKRSLLLLFFAATDSIIETLPTS